MDRGAWKVTVHGLARIGCDLVTKPPLPTFICGSVVYKAPSHILFRYMILKTTL